MKQSISFKLNGKPVSVAVEGDESLLTVIRTNLDQTGTKYGCGMGECGACTVIMDNETVRSCMLLVEDVAGKEITTIEGLSVDENYIQFKKLLLNMMPCNVVFVHQG